MYGAIFDRMLQDGLAEEGDLIVLTKGDFSGVSGGTNTMKIVQVRRGG
jgi:pyruvate kinase